MPLRGTPVRPSRARCAGDVAEPSPESSTSNAPDLGPLLHALGLDKLHPEPWRNHFVAGEGHHDLPAIERLVAEGLMERARTPGFLAPGDMVFRATARGENVARVENRRLHPPPSRSERRYDAWLRADIGVTFGEWLRGRMYEREAL